MNEKAGDPYFYRLPNYDPLWSRAEVEADPDDTKYVVSTKPGAYVFSKDHLLRITEPLAKREE